MPQTVQIEIREGARSIGSHSFSIGDKVDIGRSVDCHLVLDGKDVSRHHGTFHLEKNGFRVTDKSRNGIRTGTPQQDGLISYGSPCGIGKFQLLPHRKGNDVTNESNDSIRKQALERLIDELNLDVVQNRAVQLNYRVESVLDRLLFELGIDDNERPVLKDALRDEALGLGPLEPLLKNKKIDEIMVISPDSIYVESGGCLKKTEHIFSSESSVRTVIDRILAPLGRRIDEASPMVDARLPDGSRVNAVIPPLAIRGATITIRKFSKNSLTIDDLVSFGSLSQEMADFLCLAVKQRQNIVISGGTGSGKTTLLNVLSAQISDIERIVTIEDAAELQLNQPHVVALEAKPPNSEGRGEVTIRDLVKNALRMRPDRIIIGECRGKEALDMLQAMNTGHDGSLTTTHANSPREAIMRLETLTLLAGLDLPSRAIREQIAGAIDIIVQQKRFGDGKRRITAISEVGQIDQHGAVSVTDLWRFESVSNENGALCHSNAFQSTGWLPHFLLQGDQSI